MNEYLRVFKLSCCWILFLSKAILIQLILGNIIVAKVRSFKSILIQTFYLKVMFQRTTFKYGILYINTF